MGKRPRLPAGAERKEPAGMGLVEESKGNRAVAKACLNIEEKRIFAQKGPPLQGKTARQSSDWRGFLMRKRGPFWAKNSVFDISNKP